LYDAHEAEANRLVATNRARWAPNRRAIHLTIEPGEPGHGRTRTARGGLLGAIGRSQQYTVARRGVVVGFKRIFPEDRAIFHLATIEAMKA
jgi:hypothetical protein